MSNKSSKDHPELREGEVFLTNIESPLRSREERTIGTARFHEIIYQTKRLGEVAYTTSGQVLKGNSPVFVQRQELLEAGIDPDKP